MKTKHILWLAFWLFGALCTAQPLSAQIIIYLKPHEFMQEIEQTRHAQVLDLRTPEDYAINHIPGAVNIEPTSEDFLIDVHDQLGRSTTLFIYCRVGKPKGVGELLMANGYNVIYVLKGGYLAWESYMEQLRKGKKPKIRRQLYLGTC